MEYLIKNRALNNKRNILYIWHKNKILENIPIWQVYGFCLMPNGLVPLVRDKGEKRFTLPGGRVENGETPQETLIREFIEEVQFAPQKIKLLGSLEVIEKDINNKEINHHQQIRFFCQADSFGKFIPLRNGFEAEERIFVEPEKLASYLKWLESATGQAQYYSFMDKNNCLYAKFKF